MNTTKLKIKINIHVLYVITKVCLTCVQSDCVTPAAPRPCSRPTASSSSLRTLGSSSSLEKSESWRGRPSRFEASGPVSVKLSNRSIDTMSERTHLEENEVDLMICLLKVYSRAVRKEEPQQIRREEVPEIFLEGGILDLSGRKSLTSSEERLLGQLSVIKFRNSKDAEPVSLLNFHKSMPIRIARLPQQRKLGDKKHNKRLYSARIKTGKKWLDHLPGDFNDYLISYLFLQIDADRAETAVKTYYNKN